MKKRRIGITTDSAARAVQIALLAAAAIWMLAGTAAASRGGAAETAEVAENAIRRAAVTCYTIEGFYPADWRYLCENYGVRDLGEGYIVHYFCPGGNLAPQITVIPRGN